MRKIILACAATAMMAATALPASAKEGWVQLGTRSVGDNPDRDVISGRGEGTFTKIRLCVQGRAVHFYDLDVDFGNGGRQDVSIRKRINPGECTRAIDLRGGERNIRQVVMKYETIRDRGRQGVVELYGRR
jgi:hypothetical protein